MSEPLLFLWWRTERAITKAGGFSQGNKKLDRAGARVRADNGIRYTELKPPSTAWVWKEEKTLFHHIWRTLVRSMPVFHHRRHDRRVLAVQHR